MSTTIQKLRSAQEAMELGMEAGRTAKAQRSAYCRYAFDSAQRAYWMRGFLEACGKRNVDPILADGRDARNFLLYTQSFKI